MASGIFPVLGIIKVKGRAAAAAAGAMNMKKPRTFREYIRFQFIVYTLVPLVLLMVLFFGFFVFIKQTTLQQKNSRANTLLTTTLTGEMERYRTFLQEIVGSQKVFDLYRGGHEASALYQKFYRFNNNRDIKSRLHLIDEQGDFLLSSRPLSKNARDFFKRFIFYRIQRSGPEIFYGTDTLTYEDRSTGIYLLAAPVMPRGNIAGHVLLVLEEESFYNAINMADNEVSFVSDTFDNVMITNTRSFVNRFNKVNLQMSPGEQKQTVDGIDYTIAKSAIPEFGLWIYTANAITPMMILYYPLFIFMMAVIVLFSGLVWFLSDKVSKRTSASVTKMIDAVGHTRNAELDYRVDIRTNDEFQILGEQFNKMQEQIETLFRNNEELVNLRREAEVKQLEAQFNPHFIFNVLETLRYSLFFDQNISKEIITSLSRLLKYGIYSESKENTLTEDLRYTEEYLRLHKFRLGDKISYELDIPEELEMALVPKLILQPIIENSVKYGYRNHNALRVVLRAYRQDDWLVLQVTDDGGGVSLREFNEIRQRLQAAELPPQHTGLYNIHKRLKLMYGSESGLEIINREGESFTVLARLPFERGD